MSRSYFPTDRAGQIDWHNNFAAEFPKVGASLGFTAAEITSAVSDSNYAVYLLQTLGPEIESNPAHAALAVLEGQSQGSYVDLPSTSGAPPAVRPGIDTRRQARVERIKASSAFTFDVIGKQLKDCRREIRSEELQSRAWPGAPDRTEHGDRSIP